MSTFLYLDFSLYFNNSVFVLFFAFCLYFNFPDPYVIYFTEYKTVGSIVLNSRWHCASAAALLKYISRIVIKCIRGNERKRKKNVNIPRILRLLYRLPHIRHVERECS